MQLTEKQQAVLNGEQGETLARVMKTIVMYGEIFGAEKLVPVTHAEGHLVTSFGIALMKPLFSTNGRTYKGGYTYKGEIYCGPPSAGL